MSGSEYLLWSYGQCEKMTFFPPDPLPLTATNAVLAIIAEGGRAIIVIDRDAVEIFFLFYFIDSTKTLRQRTCPTPST
jgi:hypothetical protein